MEARPDTNSGTNDSEKTMEEAPEQRQEELPVVSEADALQSEDVISYKKTPRAPECFSSEGNSPFIREKVMEDGFNWRKYGQKLVKGNEFIRSYYRCTHRDCAAKKQLEQSSAGQIVDTVYFGQHCHPKPLGNHSAIDAIVTVNELKPNDISATVSKEKLCGSRVQTSQRTEIMTHKGLQVSIISSPDDVKTELLQPNRMKGEIHNRDCPNSKRRKKYAGNAEHGPVDRSTNEQRIVVHTQTLFDTVNDGYRWRKYGQKSVKGSPYPRSYYRCSSSGCPVKKHVERSFQDAKLVITTYEGKHIHDMPPGRIVMPNTRDLEVDKTHNKELSSKGEDVNKIPHSSTLQIVIEDQVDDESRMKPERSSTNGVIKGLISNMKSKEQTKDESDQTKEDLLGNKAVVCRENMARTLEKQESKPKTERVKS